MNIELTEQQVDWLREHIDNCLFENYSETSKAIMYQILSKLEN